MTPRKRRPRPRKGRFDPRPSPDDEDEVDEDQESSEDDAESLASVALDVRELLIHVVGMQACPRCGGFGQLQGPPRDGGGDTTEPCECRLRAREFLAGFSAPGEGG